MTAMPRPADAFGRLAQDDSGDPPLDWRKLALCTQADPKAWFPERGAATSRALRIAKETCERCPVRAECLESGLRSPLPTGVWGGLTEAERRLLRRRQRRAAAA
jgi:WhiB family redox-sensing transcriptional regulator